MSFAISGGGWAELGLAGQSIRKLMILKRDGWQDARASKFMILRRDPGQSIRKLMVLKRDPGQSIRKFMILKRDGRQHARA